jgi:Ca-activated chloride channel family protein
MKQIQPAKAIIWSRVGPVPARIVFAISCLLIAPSAVAFEWLDLWFTPEQQGQRLMDQEKYQEAATKFTSAEKIGAALFLAGDFENAATVLGRSGSADANYNRGNALIMQGQYEAAIESYQKALMKRPNWLEAEQNLEIARLRKQALAPPDDDSGGTGGQLEADEIVFDDTGRVNKSSSEQVIDASDQPMGEEAIRAMWLRKVETRPADFLAARFNYQLATRDKEITDDGAKSETGESNE